MTETADKLMVRIRLLLDVIKNTAELHEALSIHPRQITADEHTEIAGMLRKTLVLGTPDE